MILLDLAFIAPGCRGDLARQGHLVGHELVPRRRSVAVGSEPLPRLARDDRPGRILASRRTDSSSGPSHKLAAKGLIWYPVPELRAAGYEIPRTLGRASDARRTTSGPRGTPPGASDGNPGTRVAGPAPTGSRTSCWREPAPRHTTIGPSIGLPFDSPAVRRRVPEAWTRSCSTRAPCAAAPKAPRATSFFERTSADARRPAGLLAPPPGELRCRLPAEVRWAGRPTSSRSLRWPGEVHASSGAGDMIAAFSDRPEVREVVRFLLGPDYGAEMVETGGIPVGEPSFRP